MDFYFQHNLLMNDFTSCLLSWKVGQPWQLLAIGYPALEFEFPRGTFSIKFISIDGKTTSFKTQEILWNVSIGLESESILLESKSDDTDQAIAFQRPASCLKFFALILAFQRKSKLTRQYLSLAHAIHIL